MTDFDRRLRKLDEINTPDLWARVDAESDKALSTGSVPSPRRRLVTIGVAFAIFGAAAVFGWTAFRGEPPVDTPLDPAGKALVVQCGADAVSLSSNVAVAQGGGVAITVRDDGSSRLVRFSSRKLRPVPVKLTDEGADLILPLPPGKTSLECDPSEGPRQAAPTALFQVEDPQGFFKDDEVSCASPVSVRISIPHTPTPDQAVARAVRLLPGDSQTASGYPEPASDWPARRIVLREGRIVAVLDVMPTDVSGMGCAGLGMYPLGTHTYVSSPVYSIGSLDCPPGEQASGGGNFTVRPVPGHPLPNSAEAARRTFIGLSMSDLTKTTSVSEGGEYVAVVRGGRVIARARLASSADAWRVYEVAMCLDEGISVRTGQ